MSANLKMMLEKPPVAEDDYLCETTSSQKETENEIRGIYEDILELAGSGSCSDLPLDTDRHLTFVEKYLHNPLPAMYYKLDASHLWMIYWLTNSYIVLSGQPLSEDIKLLVSETIRGLVVDNGRRGIAGGPMGQIGHVASTYAAVLALALVEDYETLSCLRENLVEWYLSLKRPDGSFSMHEGGESDTRSTYCVLAVSSLLGIFTPELLRNTRNWLTSCQTYEGGFGGAPGTEAHGGYTFCALSSFIVLGHEPSDFDSQNLVKWLVSRQYQSEGGFSGRTNKLVDACYSFWVGASLVIMESTLLSSLFNRQSLRSYIHNCCQLPDGGLRDKPGKYPDFYHTNYALCGLSMAEFEYSGSGPYDYAAKESAEGSAYTIPVNPVLGIPLDAAQKCAEHFK